MCVEVGALPIESDLIPNRSDTTMDSLYQMTLEIKCNAFDAILVKTQLKTLLMCIVTQELTGARSDRAGTDAEKHSTSYC